MYPLLWRWKQAAGWSPTIQLWPMSTCPVVVQGMTREVPDKPSIETVERYAGLGPVSCCEHSFRRVGWVFVVCEGHLRPFPASIGPLWSSLTHLLASFPLLGMIVPWPRA